MSQPQQQRERAQTLPPALYSEVTAILFLDLQSGQQEIPLSKRQDGRTQPARERAQAASTKSRIHREPSRRHFCKARPLLGVASPWRFKLQEPPTRSQGILAATALALP